jgi:hypothetical protein
MNIAKPVTKYCMSHETSHLPRYVSMPLHQAFASFIRPKKLTNQPNPSSHAGKKESCDEASQDLQQK